MLSIKRLYMKPVILLLVIIFAGCASVPKEVVELSYTMGQDIEALHLSYRSLIQTHFENMRQQRLAFLNDELIPLFIERFVENGKLVEMAQGSDPDTVLEDVQLWAEVAVEKIEQKKKQIIDPINEDERKLLDYVNEAFSQVIRANAVVTAHLNSIRKVQEVQDDVLKALNIKNLRDRINYELAAASVRADNALEELKKAEGLIDDISEKRDEIMDTIEGEDNNE